MHWQAVALLWLILGAVGALLVHFDASRRGAGARPALGAFLVGPLGLAAYFATRDRPEDPWGLALRTVGAAAPGFAAGFAISLLVGLPVGFGLVLAAAGAFASAEAVRAYERGAATPAERLRVAGFVGGAVLVLALLLPRVVSAWSLARVESWAVLSAGAAGGLLVAGLVATLLARPALSRRSFRTEETVAIALLLVGAGFAAASPAGALRATEASLLASCRGEASPMGSMPGMGMDMDMDMGAGDRPGDCPDGGMGMGGMDMGGMDMRPAERAGAPVAEASARGGARLEPTPIDGVKTYVLTAGRLVWSILPDVQVGAYAYNGQLPGPLLVLTPNESVRIRVVNELPENTTMHLHGLQIPNDMDGVPYLEQRPIPPGGSFDHEFVVPDTPGTYFYHSHFAADRQQALGLYGALIIEGGAAPVAADVPVVLGEWTVRGEENVASMSQPGMEPNFFTINGKSYPATDNVTVKVGDRVRLRVVGAGQFIHPMHLHGQPFTIVATDGNPVPEGARLMKDTVLVGPGERYDLEFTARAPGTWLFHCHINDHITNNGEEIEGGGGLTMRIIVTEA